jgi:hypothetical protein
VKVVFFANGQLERGNACAERTVQLLENVGKIGPFPVQLVHEHKTRCAELGRRLPEYLRLYFNTVDGADDEHREVGHRKRRQRFGYEIRITGTVQDIDLVAAPFECRKGKAGRHVMGVFFRLEVRNGGPVFDPASPVRSAAAKQ